MDTTVLRPADENGDETTMARTRRSERAHARLADGARTRLSKKVRALLAGGLVLGLGATVTLASWNDSEFATGSFSAGRFNLEGSTDGTNYASHASSSPASLAFTLPATNLSPGDAVFAGFAVRLDSTTTSDAGVEISVASTGGELAGLTYSLIQSSSFSCDDTTTGTTLVSAGTALDPASGVAAFDLDKGAADTAGDSAYLCFVVSAGAITQGQTGTVTWEFVAESTS